MTYTELIEASKALSEKATGGVWFTEDDAVWGFSLKARMPEGGAMHLAVAAGLATHDDLRLAAHARTALPALVQGLEAALRCIEAMRALTVYATAAASDSYCECCMRHAPKNERGTLTGYIKHADDCALFNARAALSHFDSREQAHP